MSQHPGSSVGASSPSVTTSRQNVIDAQSEFRVVTQQLGTTPYCNHMPAYFTPERNRRDLAVYIKYWTNQYVITEVHSLIDPMLRAFPREIRDMIYELLCEDSEEPFYVIDNTRMPPWSNEYCFEPLIKAFDLPYWMDPAHVGEEFAAEAAHVWYKDARLSINIKSLSDLMYDVGGVLVGSGGPRMKAKELIRYLEVRMSKLPHHLWEDKPLSSDKAVPYHRAARDLQTLLGPTGIKYKQGFKLHLIIPCWGVVYERYAQALGPAIALMKEEGFLVTVELEHYVDVFGPSGNRIGAMTSYFELMGNIGERLLED